MPSYREESAALDAAILRAIAAWHERGEMLNDDAFNELALAIFAYQLTYNAPYAAYCASLGVTTASPPQHWEAIPPVPSAAFKETTLATFAPSDRSLRFETSGTTQGDSGRHHMEDGSLYDAASLAAFDAFVLPDRVRLRYINLVPNPAENPRSSLGYMMRHVATLRGDGETAWLLHDGELQIGRFLDEIESAVAHDRPVCIATTAFALVHVLDALSERERYFALPAGSRVMETGGFKGRSRYVERSELYTRTAERFGVPLRAIVAEYGMTELASQYYDDVLLRDETDERIEPRYKRCGPWMRTRIVAPDGATLPKGSVGAIVHVDLANRSSCIAIQTEDLAVEFDDGFVLMGRETGAQLRGCSLAAEDLVSR